MSYHLGRLRLNGLIDRLPGHNSFLLTPDGQRVAILYTKRHHRLLRPLLAADAPPAPPPLRNARATIDRDIGDYISDARVANTA
jgi:hypothetical protein